MADQGRAEMGTVLQPYSCYGELNIYIMCKCMPKITDQPVPVEQTNTRTFLETGARTDVTSSICPSSSDRASSPTSTSLVTALPPVT